MSIHDGVRYASRPRPSVAVAVALLVAGLLPACGASASSPADTSSGRERENAASIEEPLGTVYDTRTTTIEARPGDRFSVALPHDDTMTWKIDPELDQSVTRIVDQRVRDGSHYVLFEAVGIGPTDLRFRQRGPATPPPGPPAQEVTIRVRVETAQ